MCVCVGTRSPLKDSKLRNKLVKRSCTGRLGRESVCVCVRILEVCVCVCVRILEVSCISVFLRDHMILTVTYDS